MKKLIAIIIIIIIAVVAIFAVNYINRPGQEKEPVREGISVNHNLTSLPEITVYNKDTAIGSLIGYNTEMEYRTLRDNLTVVDYADRKVGITADFNGINIKSFKYQIKPMDEDRLIDNGELSQVKGTRNIDETIPISAILEENIEYILQFIVDTEEIGIINYYTRVMVTKEDFVTKQAAFAKQFSEYTMDTSKSREIAQYMEIDPDLLNNHMGRVTLSNNFNLVAWANLIPDKQKGGIFNLKEVCVKDTGVSGTYEMKYQVSAEGNNNIVDTYDIIETITVWTYNEKNYVLAYERRMNQVWNADENTVNNTFIDLGIQQDMDICFKQSEDGDFIVYEVNGSLWMLQLSTKTLTNIYNVNSRYKDLTKVVPARVDNEGNVNFVVCGYSTENVHVGKNGISVCRYNNKSKSVEEKVFLEYNRQADLIEDGIREVCHTSDSVLYIKLGEELCYVNLETKETGVITNGLNGYTYASNEKGSTIAYVSEDASYINVINLASGEEHKIEAGANEKIRVCGYTGDNLVYGTISSKKVKDNDNKFSISKLFIVDKDFNEIISYSKKNVEISDVEITDSVINLTRVQDGKKIENDQLLDNTSKEPPAAKQSYYDDTKKYRELALSLTLKMSANLETTVVNNITKNISASVATFQPGEEGTLKYYVYACGELKGIFEESEKKDAEKLAKEKDGLVITSQGNKVWTFEENYD